MAKTMNSEPETFDIESLKKVLSALESPKDRKARERAAVFSQLYELIRDKLNCSVSKRQILDLLADYGLVLTYDQFAELLAAEAKRRGEPVPGKESEAGDDLMPDESMNAPQADATEKVIA